MAAGPRGVLHRLRALEAPDLRDGELLERYLTERDEAAFEALVRRHGSMVFGACRRLLPTEQDAEDATQATFLVLVHKSASVPRNKVGAWLYGVACRAARKARTADTRRQARERSAARPETVADERLGPDLRPVLDEELGRLPEKYRLVLVLCDLEGGTRAEVARQLGWPEGTVAGRLARGRDLLDRRLRRRGLPLSSAAVGLLLAQEGASAGLPPRLVTSALEAASAFAAGRAAPAVSARVLLMTERVCRAMFLTKLTKAAGVLLAVATCALLGWLTHAAVAPGEAPGASLEAPRPAGKDEKKLTEAEAAVKKEFEALRGKWKVVGLEADGRVAPAEALAGMSWTFEGRQLRPIDPNLKEDERAAVTLDPSKSPRHIDLLQLAGPHKGKKVLGIYKIEKGRLIVRLRGSLAADRGRPTDFTTEEKGGDLGTITLERAKK